MKKTLIITLEYPPTVGGIATYIDDLAGAFDPAQTIVLAPHHKDEKAWDEKRQFTIVRKNLLFPKGIWPRWIKLYFITRKIVKQHNIEILLIHHVLPVGYIGILMKKWAKVPFLLFSHGTDLVAGTQKKHKKNMVRWVSGKAEQIIFNSESLKHRFLQALPEFESKSLVMYPCPEKRFMEEPDAQKVEELRHQYALAGKQVMLSVSRLTDGKGFPHLIRIMPRVLEKYPNLVWFIVGGGDKQDQIFKLIQENNLQNVVRFIGEIPHAELYNYYHLADLFVLLTHPDEGREEGLGLVFLEAAASGIPTIAGKSGGVEEAVIHGQTGLVLDIFKGDPQVAEAILSLLEDKEYAKKLGTQAQERIKQDFQWEKKIALLNPWLG